MNDTMEDILKIGAVAVGAYLIWNWLQSSGLLGAATSSTFTTGDSLMTYCQANPTGSATYTDPSGVTSTATCAAWIASQAPASVPASTSSSASSLGSNYQQAISAMQTAAGNDMQTLDVWAYYWQNGAAFAGSPAGYGIPGSISSTQMDQMIGLNGGNRSAPVSSEMFVGWLNDTGSSGGMGYAPLYPMMTGVLQ